MLNNFPEHVHKVTYMTGMSGAELFPAGRGEDENPRGGAGWGKKARRSTDPKI